MNCRCHFSVIKLINFSLMGQNINVTFHLHALVSHIQQYNVSYMMIHLHFIYNLREVKYPGIAFYSNINITVLFNNIPRIYIYTPKRRPRVQPFLLLHHLISYNICPKFTPMKIRHIIMFYCRLRLSSHSRIYYSIPDSTQHNEWVRLCTYECWSGSVRTG